MGLHVFPIRIPPGLSDLYACLCGSPCCFSGLACLFSFHLLRLQQTPYLILQTQARFTFSVKCSMSVIALPICFHRILFIKLLLTITCLYSLLDWDLSEGRNQFFSFFSSVWLTWHMYTRCLVNEWMNKWKLHAERRGENWETSDRSLFWSWLLWNSGWIASFQNMPSRFSKMIVDSQSQHTAGMDHLHIYLHDSESWLVGPTRHGESGRKLPMWGWGLELLTGDLVLCPLEDSCQVLPDFLGPGPIDDGIDQTWKQQVEGAEQVVHILGGSAGHAVDNGRGCRWHDPLDRKP